MAQHSLLQTGIVNACLEKRFCEYSIKLQSQEYQVKSVKGSSKELSCKNLCL